jgi:hypothetical protein
MQLLIESTATTTILRQECATCGELVAREVRIWTGETDSGVTCTVFVALMVAHEADQAAFEAEQAATLQHATLQPLRAVLRGEV